MSEIATLSAVVDFPTPPFPDATAIIFFTSGASSRDFPLADATGCWSLDVVGLFSLFCIPLCAVRTADTERTPGIFLTTFSASLRRGSRDGPLFGSTSIEKPTLPFLIIISLIIPRLTRSFPSSGSFIAANFSKIFSLEIETMLEISSKATICDSVRHINVVQQHPVQMAVLFA